MQAFRQRLQHELATRHTIGFGDFHLNKQRQTGSPAETKQVDRQAARHRQTEACTPGFHAASGQNLASNRLDTGKAQNPFTLRTPPGPAVVLPT